MKYSFEPRTPTSPPPSQKWTGQGFEIKGGPARTRPGDLRIRSRDPLTTRLPLGRPLLPCGQKYIPLAKGNGPFSRPRKYIRKIHTILATGRKIHTTFPLVNVFHLGTPHRSMGARDAVTPLTSLSKYVFSLTEIHTSELRLGSWYPCRRARPVRTRLVGMRQGIETAYREPSKRYESHRCVRASS